MSVGTTARPSLARVSGDECPANTRETPPKWRSSDQQSTKPKVTGSNPVGRALRRRWISLNCAKSCGAGEICLIWPKSPFLSGSRTGLSLEQAHGLRRDKTHLVDRPGARPRSQGRRFESGPATFLATTRKTPLAVWMSLDEPVQPSALDHFRGLPERKENTGPPRRLKRTDSYAGRRDFTRVARTGGRKTWSRRRKAPASVV